MNRYDDYTDSFISEDIDMRSYMLGYLKGCEDTIKKVNEINKMQFSIPLREQYMKGGAE